MIPVVLPGLGLLVTDLLAAQNFTTLYTFTGDTDGANPMSGMILSSNALYGTASAGGSSFLGTVFKLNTDGSGFITLHNFAGYQTDGADPQAGLVLSGNTLYGTASSSGSSGNGTVFRLNTDGLGYTNLYAFPLLNGYAPQSEAGLMLSGNTLYGTTSRGGGWDVGTVFKVSIDGSGFLVVHEFNGNYGEGAIPMAGLILSENTLYGTTQQGGDSPEGSNGTVFAMTNNAGSGFFYPQAILHSFTPFIGSNPSANSDGANPVAGLILSGTTLYGTAEHGGGSGNGTVFKLNIDGRGFTTLHSFGSGSDGAYPTAGLILSGDTLYGTTFQGGSSGNGTVFAVSTNGTGFTNLYNFTGGTDGANPMGGVILSGNTLYGTTYGGGSSSLGTVFSLSLGPVNPPQLVVISARANVILTWTNSASGYTLQSTYSLVPPIVWAAVSVPPVVVNGQNTVTNLITGKKQFFRLSQ